MLSAASSRSVRRDRPDAAHRGGESIAMTSGRRSRIRRSTSGTRTCETTCSGHAALVQQHEVESLADPDVDPERTHRQRWALPTVGEEVQQVAPGQHAEHLARLGDQHGGPVLQLGERRLDRVVPLHHRDRRAPSPRRRRPAGRRDRGRPAPAARGRGSNPRTASRRHPPRARPAPGRCRARLQDVDGLPHLVVGVDGDQGRAARSPLAASTSLDADHVGPVEDAVLQHPRVGVDLGQVLATGVGQQHDDRSSSSSSRAPPRARRRPPTRTSHPPGSLPAASRRGP